MNPSRMSYRDHGKPYLASFRIRISTLLGPNLTTYLSMTVLQDLPIPQLWNVLLRSRVELLHLSVVFGSYRWLLVLLPVCRALSRLRDRTSIGRYDRGIRLAMTVMPSVTRPVAFSWLHSTTSASSYLRP